MAVNTPYVTLNDGNKMPQVGFGLWKVDNDTCADTVYNAIKTGYRLFDGACGMYNSQLRFQNILTMSWLCQKCPHLLSVL
jgi:diketogulonate reductase-like aldo/keto reductase